MPAAGEDLLAALAAGGPVVGRQRCQAGWSRPRNAQAVHGRDVDFSARLSGQVQPSLILGFPAGAAGRQRPERR